ncbi:hypothetical protein A2641_01110 [Candidatus Nomurabacteria bacterium RIFCSPHIGHO2_01_FULL_37_25]|uniref:DUF5673 domain-containing protein n=1 Tax=Candidatus Nomurabacteria bacterium RIFCSPLOWO2_01_FULL_36_16 TaxID=1801767 RepID=A0A1F6WZB5_9BACT|nr:MAG: hypothetical protein A2641_01110 [Candidatus Nomurabacteria bacterium RIFCSPHIGHO2_01_FULL_37_25]OGI75318.1 MAG: hypothetical protein A3D36_02010 [Candidatus Nomurabacteria bacterium RIFCSPHIGHO2_02_FULL_36_29]OGI87065.1 MAG: hypothetical protein A3A91_00105 [Candidatus Nomurabacteria bacterium RIFCSPLOWO2_01_FULL_36_16]OGI95930.1 MAG: hypothetical protein A3I84_01265 [Candidatus Nomurabacteria bacterium RIFCSPLOWO2_02_FULL_36_8]
MEKLQWSALEYEEKDRNNDWFWALGIIVVTSSVAAIIYENYFFAALLFLSGILLWFFAIKKPDMVSYELNNQGLKIRTTLYPYENIKSFWIQIGEDEETKLPPTLFINSERFFMPILSIPIEYDIAHDIHSIMVSRNIMEEEMRDHLSIKVMEFLGF